MAEQRVGVRSSLSGDPIEPISSQGLPQPLFSSKPELRQIQGLEAALKAMPTALGPKDFPLFHHFARGVYVRELHLPAGTVAVGEMHRHDCVNIVIGEVDVLTGGDEESMRPLSGVNVFTSPGGAKRAVRTHSPVIWITVHANPENVRDEPTLLNRLTVDPQEILKALRCQNCDD